MMASLTYYAFLFSIFFCSSGRRLWGIIECPRKMEEYGISKKHFHFEPKYVAYFEENVFFGATSIEAHMTLWSALSACKTVNGYITVGNLIINVHFFSLNLHSYIWRNNIWQSRKGRSRWAVFAWRVMKKLQINPPSVLQHLPGTAEAAVIHTPSSFSETLFPVLKTCLFMNNM